MFCFVKIISLFDLILTYYCDSGVRKEEREWKRKWIKAWKVRARKRERERTSECMYVREEEIKSKREGAKERERERNVINGIVTYGSRKSFLRAYRKRGRRARCPDCTLSRIRKLGDTTSRWNETWRSARRAGQRVKQGNEDRRRLAAVIDAASM